MIGKYTLPQRNKTSWQTETAKGENVQGALGLVFVLNNKGDYSKTESKLDYIS